MNPELIPERELMELAEVGTRKALKQWLDQHGVRHFTGRKGKITTTRYYLNHPDDRQDGVEFA